MDKKHFFFSGALAVEIKMESVRYCWLAAASNIGKVSNER